MDLNILWFLLITVLFIGFFFLEGFDYGVGALIPFLGKDDDERRVVLNTIGPFWDGNEVWLITAGGALFAAFPHVYATMFSGFYIALFLILVALIFRATGIEFRSLQPSLKWRKNWDAIIAISSILSAILWGVAVSNLVTGVPIDADMQYSGSFYTLLTPFTILGGVVFALLFLYHGATYLQLKVGEQKILDRLRPLAPKLGLAMIVATVLWVVYAFFVSDIFNSTLAMVLCAAAAVMMILSVWKNHSGKAGFAFITIGLSIVCTTATVFAGIFPDIMISTLNPKWSLDIYNASSSPKTLRLMTFIALTLVPIVLAYQTWSFYVFRKRVTKNDLHY
ncbi:cytochrome bd-I ubiquinol oxidase subunit 2 apoprotein [Desulfonispora thiosulfatigenes DSM 11270]|uniref:Cytochrome bd-I ubiquinol oxidase subunit 2 apoprotein n=1 Tax=Desulfonispora thiosulfatigenes DSM 11270 TaxID=656914 RepID=A0A1W1UFW4_DESTI|nr:cytochrome d ubiquinol oxidase subunit II [Desulfonispora thiosulfatigenes]SMB79929.1 cytochrome bd-I ubiquinol oxidase subunit 2 apoprotein [Desulfonispora thiosulfatigenes DSM 11270]